MICLICQNLKPRPARLDFEHLGSHIYHAHKIKARDYKRAYGLDLKFPLISATVKQKKQIAFAEHRDKYIANLNLEHNQRYRFKKGQVNRDYFSRQSIDRALANIANFDLGPRLCPICNLSTKHLPSHLANYHGLAVINKNKYLKNTVS